MLAEGYNTHKFECLSRSLAAPPAAGQLKHPMLDPKLLRSDPEGVAKDLSRRGYVLDLNAFRALEEKRRETDMEIQELQAARKRMAKRVGALVGQGSTPEEARRQAEEEQGGALAALEEIKIRERKIHREVQDFLAQIPNIPDERVPDGTEESHNREIARWGETAPPDFSVQDHVALGEGGGIDFEAAVGMAGARFAVLRGAAARLHRALGQFMLDLHTREHGYQEVSVPCIANRQALYGTGQLPKFEADLFRLAGEQNLYLIPTGEVPITSLVQGQILSEKEVAEPVRLAALTPCFRSEAGSHGKDTRGMIRQHQFEKVELVQILRPDNSDAGLEELTDHAETVLQQLELPYRKVMLCTGDLGFAARCTYDLEVWLPGQQRYREISSCSNFGDFQARRIMARWRNPATGKPEYLHTLNGSGLAVGRCLVAVLENFQNRDGSIRLPEALRPYMDGAAEIRLSSP